MTICCNVCEKQLSRLRIGAHWPTSIPCGSCGTKHSFRFGHLIGLVYVLLLIPLCLFSLVLGGYFASVEDGIYSTGAASFAIQYGSLALFAILACALQGTLLGRFGVLQNPKPSGSDSYT